MTFDVVIIGLGYVGLPLAQQATRAGLKVLGWRYRDTLPAGRAHARLPSIEAAAMLGLPVFRAMAELALTLPL